MGKKGGGRDLHFHSRRFPQRLHTHLFLLLDQGGNVGPGNGKKGSGGGGGGGEVPIQVHGTSSGNDSKNGSGGRSGGGCKQLEPRRREYEQWRDDGGRSSDEQRSAMHGLFFSIVKPPVSTP